MIKSIPELILIIFLTLCLTVIIGIIGFRTISGLSLIDAFHNSCMYATTMGPLFEMKTTKQKLFSALYAIIAGMIFFTITIAFIDRIINLRFFS
jgi:hypothetical protein